MSIRTQALILLLGPNIVALAVACGLLIQFAAKHQLLQETRSLAALVGVQALSGLAKDDPGSAELAILSVTSNDRVEAAGVYSRSGDLIAQFRRDYSTGDPLPDVPGAAGHQFGSQHLEVVVPAEAGGTQLGSVYIRAAKIGFWADSLAYARVAALAALVGLVPALVALHLLRRRVIVPIELVAREAEIYSSGDLREREFAEAHGEVGHLVTGFLKLGGSLRELVRGVRSEVLDLETSRQILSDRSLAAADRAAEQAGTVESAATSLEKLGEGFESLVSSLGDLSSESRTSASASNQIRAGARGVLEASESLALVTEQVASATEETASSVKQIVSSVCDQDRDGELAGEALAELSESVESVRMRAQRVGTLSRESEEAVKDGQRATESASGAMVGISDAFAEIERDVGNLAEASGTIEAVVSTIDGITSRTQLLSLNASIIAAQAGGEYGRAFSVVASEIRSLASEAADSAAKIADLVASVQESVASTVQTTQGGRSAVDAGVARVSDVGDAFSQVLVRAGEAAEDAEQNGEIADRQEIALTSVVERIGSIKQGVAQVLAAVQEQERTAREVSGSIAEGHMLAKRLQSAVTEQLKACDVAGASAEEVDRLVMEMDTLVGEQRIGASTIRDTLPLFRDSVRSTLTDIEQIAGLVGEFEARSSRLQQGVEDLRTD